MAGEELILATVLAIILVLVILRAAVKAVREYERLVIFRLGRLLSQPKGPGLTVIIPIFDRRGLIYPRPGAVFGPPPPGGGRGNRSPAAGGGGFHPRAEPPATGPGGPKYL